MKCRIFLFVLGVMIIFIGMNDVKALEVANLNPSMQSGETENIDLYVNVPDDTEKVTFLLSFLSYDVIGSFESSISTLTNDGITHSVSFDKPVEGRVKLGMIKIKISDNPTINTSTINLYNANAISVDGVITKLNNQSIQVNIKKEEVKTNLLKKINSDIVNISLKPNKYEYDVLVKNEVDKLDLNAIAIDETYKIDITDQSLKEGKNQIFINVTKGDILEKYIINVTREKKEESKEEIKSESWKEQVSKIENKNFKSGWTGIITGLGVIFIVGLFMLKKK